MTTRRTFLGHSSLAIAGLTLTVPRTKLSALPSGSALQGTQSPALDGTIYIDDPSVRSLAMHAIDAAKTAGASYADVRLTRTLQHDIRDGFIDGNNETLAVGVRALFNGYWGFAACPYWSLDEVAWLARDATAQAKLYAAAGTPRKSEWAPIPAVSGTWATPVRYDAFTIPIEEKSDHAMAWCALGAQFDRRAATRMEMFFYRQERAIATSDGAYFTQTVHRSSGNYRFIIYTKKGGVDINAEAFATGLDHTGAGWELFLDARIPDQLPKLLDEVEAKFKLREARAIPGDVGRYDIVLDAQTMARLTAYTLGLPTQLDRALGFEANASGTSYLGPDPLEFLGTQVASPIVNVTANRSMSGGLATVKWDNEGVVPTDYQIVRDGMLVDYQTTRDQGAWLAPWYQKRGAPMPSHGCADASSALDITMQHMPNLVLEPGRGAVGFDDMIANTKRGLAITNGKVDADFQSRNGTIYTTPGECREIVNGRLGAVVTSLTPVFTSTQLWKNVGVVGGAAGVKSFSFFDTKGEPSQTTPFTVRAVPATVTNIACVDPSKRA